LDFINAAAVASSKPSNAFICDASPIAALVAIKSYCISSVFTLPFLYT
jgi:hypothetical protein